VLSRGSAALAAPALSNAKLASSAQFRRWSDMPWSSINSAQTPVRRGALEEQWQQKFKQPLTVFFNDVY
jgi:hypothetical protein